MNEEIVAKFGANTTEIDRAMRGLKAKGKDLATSFKGFFNLPTAAGLLSIGALTSAFDKLANRVDTIKRISETSGLDTGIVQDITNLAKAAGIAEGRVEKLLSSFAKGLKPGENPAEKLRNIADKMASISDPGQRARYAVEQLGEAGLRLIPILSKGSEEIDKIASRFGRLSTEEIKSIDDASDRIDELTSRSQVAGAGVFNFFAKLAEGINRLKIDRVFNMLAPSFQLARSLGFIGMGDGPGKAKGGSDSGDDIEKAEKMLVKNLELLEKAKLDTADKREKIRLLKEERDAWKSNLKALERAAETGRENDAATIKAKAEIIRLNHAITQSEKEIADEQSRQADAVKKAKQAVTDANAEKLNQFRPTLEDLASNRGPMQDKARRATDLQDKIRKALISGDTKTANDLTKQLYGGDAEPTGNQAQRDFFQRIRDKQNAWRRGRGLSDVTDPTKINGLIPDLEKGGMKEDGVIEAIEKANAELLKVMKEDGIKTRGHK